MKKCKELLNKHSDKLYSVFRILIGLMFLVHGVQKFLGGISSLVMGVAGVAEVVAGLLVLLGFFARPAAVLGAVTMLVAYGFHTFGFGAGFVSLSPFANGGELALMYLLAFLVVLKEGNGKCSLEKKLLKKETF